MMKSAIELKFKNRKCGRLRWSVIMACWLQLQERSFYTANLPPTRTINSLFHFHHLECLSSPPRTPFISSVISGIHGGSEEIYDVWFGRL